MIGLSWRLTALAVLLVPAFVLPARRIGRSLAELSRELSRHNASLVSTMTERLGVAGATLVKLFGVPHNEARAFDTQARAISDVGVRTVMYGRLYFGFLGLMALLAQALTYGLGGRLILTGATSPAVVVTFALLLTRLYTPLTNLSGVRLDVTTAMVSGYRIKT